MFERLKMRRNIKSQTHFIWGVKSTQDTTSDKPNIYTTNDIDICYNSVKHTYVLRLRTLREFKTTDATMQHVEKLLSLFNRYLKDNDLFDCSYNPFKLHPYNSGKLFEGNSLTELYYKFKIFVKGFTSL